MFEKGVSFQSLPDAIGHFGIGGLSVAGGGAATFAPTITPTLGAEKVPTGHAASIVSEANATTGLLSNNAVLSSVADPCPISGSYSIDAQVSDTSSETFGNFVLSVGSWILVDCWLKFTGGAGGYLFYSPHAIRSWPSGNVSTATWSRRFFLFTAAAGGAGLDELRISGNTTNAHHRFDNYSVKPITLESCIATPLTTSTGDVIASAMVSMAAADHPWAGVICNIDNISNIQNCVWLFIDREKIYLHKMVTGIVTYVASQNITYVDGAPVQLHKSGTTYKMYYNGAQVGADQTISDATVKDNVNHAQFSVSPLATFVGYSLA
jgi:hypothetical protein